MAAGGVSRLAEARSAFVSNALDRNLRRAQLSFAGAWAGEWTLTVVLGVVAFRDGGASAVGLVALLRMAPAALLAPLGSTLADRFPRERILMWIGVLRAAALGLAALVLAGEGPLVAVYALAIAATVVFTVYRPAHSALLPSLCQRPEQLTSANAVRGLVDSGSTLLGPLLAAVLLDVTTAAVAFGVVAAMSLVSGALAGAVRFESPPRAQGVAKRRIFVEAAAGFRVLAGHPGVRLISALTLVQTFTRGTFNVFSVVVAIDLLETGEAGVGVLTGAVGAGAVIGSLAASLLVGSPRLAGWFALGVALWGLPIALIGVLPSAVLAVLLLAVVGIGNALVDVGLFTLPGRLVADEHLARVFGALESLIALSVGLGSIVTPALIGLVGVRPALVILGLIAPLATLLATVRVRTLDREVVVHDREIGVLREVGMFRPLSVASIEQLARGLRRTSAETGSVVIRQGEPGDTFYVIARGQADVVRDAQLTETLGSGDYFGEIALLRDVPRTATVCARTQLDLFELDRARFLAAVGGYRASSAEADAVVRRRSAQFHSPQSEPETADAADARAPAAAPALSRRASAPADRAPPMAGNEYPPPMRAPGVATQLPRSSPASSSPVKDVTPSARGRLLRPSLRPLQWKDRALTVLGGGRFAYATAVAFVLALIALVWSRKCGQK